MYSPLGPVRTDSTRSRREIIPVNPLILLQSLGNTRTCPPNKSQVRPWSVCRAVESWRGQKRCPGGTRRGRGQCCPLRKPGMEGHLGQVEGSGTCRRLLSGSRRARSIRERHASPRSPDSGPLSARGPPGQPPWRLQTDWGRGYGQPPSWEDPPPTPELGGSLPAATQE